MRIDPASTVRVLSSLSSFALALALAACGDAPPPPAKSTPSATVRVHVANGSRFDICAVSACGAAGRAVDTGGPTPGNPPLKPHAASLYEVKRCPGSPIVVTACAASTQNEPAPPCLKAEGGNVDEGTMFRVAPCSF